MMITTKPSEIPIVRFPVEFELPSDDGTLLANATEAVRREYRASIRWKRLRCRSVTRVSDRSDESIFVLELGQSVEFDWTWEGAKAFRPNKIGEFNGDLAHADDSAGDEQSQGAAWSGEVVEVDEANGRIFVWIENPESPPTTGSFYIRPFEFLASCIA